MKIIVSGVCGFIGAHTAFRLSQEGYEVVGFDNLSRAGTVHNQLWLKDNVGKFDLSVIDIRNRSELESFVSKHSDAVAIIHLAAQVAVTTSVADPKLDFDTNALGTLNLLEAVRLHCPNATFLFASTNKVYGQLEHLSVVEGAGRYDYGDLPQGIDELTNLDFHSPYGCSKGCADQYVRDYCRIYGVPSVVFRQSCIYGTRQFGVEDQGWIAWLTICATLRLPITIFGDGKQVRDVLWIEDLVQLYIMAIERIKRVRGKVYNVGGGYRNSLSILELLSLLERLSGHSLEYGFSDWRPGDQKVYISDIASLERDFGWRPAISPEAGVTQLLDWTKQSEGLIREILLGAGCCSSGI